LIDRARMLTKEEIKRLYAAAYAAGPAARYVARLAAAYAAGPAARYAAENAARYAAWDAARYAAWLAAWDAAGYAAENAARDAARALVVKDLISSEQFELLYGSWGKVIG